MFATLNSNTCSTTTIEQPCCASTSSAIANRQSQPESSSVSSSSVVDSPKTPTMPSNETLVSLTDRLTLSSQHSGSSSSNNKSSLHNSTASLPIPAPVPSALNHVGQAGSASFSSTLHRSPSASNASPNGGSQPSSSNNGNPAHAPITAQHIRKLLKHFSVRYYQAHRSQESVIEDQCIHLFGRDYPSHVIITNQNGELSHSYPAKIFLPETDDFLPHLSLPLESESNSLPRANTYSASCSFSSHPYNVSFASDSSAGDDLFRSSFGRDSYGRLDPKKIKDLMLKARVARCRARFPVPVIVYRNRYICRSATLSGAAELVGRTVYDYCTQSEQTPQTPECPKTKPCEEEAVIIESPPKNGSLSKASQHSSLMDSIDYRKAQRSKSVDSGNIFSVIRNKDISLLKFFNVTTIFDLMLEMKKVKYGMIMTSSEKADKESRYANFDIFVLPYPGCEFFREFRDANYVGEGLIYNWNQSFVDTELKLPNINLEDLQKTLSVDFNDYREWDVISLTQNYLKLLIKILRDNESSMLVHCISGWDRTPLFISLLRLTLWADGEIHRSLNALEITYLTLAYDWYLFGHQLSDRLAKGEEIMFFCFQFLKNIIDDEFSINYLPPLGDVKLSPPQPHKPSVFRPRNDSIDSADKTDFVLADDVLLLGSSSSSGSGPSQPPNLFNCDPIANDELFNAEFLGGHPGPSGLTPDNGMSSSMCILGDVDDDDDINDFEKFKNGTDTMTSTLTEEATEEYFGKAESSPMNIPTASSRYQSIAQNVGTSSSGNTTKLSLNRNDSWQVVSDAGSIRDNFLIHQLSSPDSSNYSPRRDNYLTDSPLFSRHHFGHSSSSAGSNNSGSNMFGSRNHHHRALSLQTRQGDRKRKLMEVRSIFNAAYTSLNFSHNNGRFTNLVENFVSPFYSSSTTKDSV